MPELPEIEHLRRTLVPHLIGARITRVDLHRRDIVRIANSRKPMRGVKGVDLLEGATISEIIRRGKSLAIIGDNGRVLGTHMGMSGSLQVVDARDGVPRDRHAHCEWRLSRTLRGKGQVRRLVFRDPRRFGGLWPFGSIQDLHDRAWSRLGPDALTIDGDTLRERLARTRQPIKAALLNQALVAGVGNIYADEALFAAAIHPLTKPARISESRYAVLADAIRSIMLAALDSGGSTLRDYRDATGQAGGFAIHHSVYGRGGEACVRCRSTLRSATIGQRTTVFCPSCQSRGPARRR